MTDKGEMVLAQMLCLESPESSRQKPHLSKCHEMGGLQEWKHHDDVRTLTIFYFVDLLIYKLLMRFR